MPGTRIERCPPCQICCKQLKADKRYVKIGDAGISLSIVARTGKACHLVRSGSLVFLNLSALAVWSVSKAAFSE